MITFQKLQPPSPLYGTELLVTLLLKSPFGEEIVESSECENAPEKVDEVFGFSADDEGRKWFVPVSHLDEVED
jgi:hypothetical protein